MATAKLRCSARTHREKASDRGLGGRARASGLREREEQEREKTDKTGWEVGFGETHGGRRVAWPWCCSYRRVRRIRVDALLERDATWVACRLRDGVATRKKRGRRRSGGEVVVRSPRGLEDTASRPQAADPSSKSPTGRPTDRPTIFVEKYFSAGASPRPVRLGR